MILFINKISFTVFLVSTLISFASSQENLLDYDNSLEFARYLKSTRQYDFATDEYERLNFLWPGDTTISLELVSTYRLNKQCNRLDFSYELLKKNISRNHSLSSAKEYLAFSLTCKSASDRFSEISSLFPPAEKHFYELSHLWVNKKYDTAFTYNRENEDFIKNSKPDLYSLTSACLPPERLRIFIR